MYIKKVTSVVQHFLFTFQFKSFEEYGPIWI